MEGQTDSVGKEWDLMCFLSMLACMLKLQNSHCEHRGKAVEPWPIAGACRTINLYTLANGSYLEDSHSSTVRGSEIARL